MEYCDERGLLCKAKSFVSSLYGIVLWTSTLPSMQSLPKYHQCPIPPGLKTLIYTPSLQGLENPSFPSLIIHSYMIRLGHSQSKQSPPSSSSLFRSFTQFSLDSWNYAFDDLIGSENGAYMSYEEQEPYGGFLKKSEDICVGNKKNQCAESEKKTYPPPIPLLARTGNLLGHIPWILTRHYTNGKLVLREEKVKHHEYFESHRANGRLVLNLISLDDKVNCNHSDCSNNPEELELQDFNDFFSQEDEQTQEDTEDDEDEEEEKEIAETLMTPLSTACSVPKSNKLKLMREEGSGDLRQCFTYSGKMSSEFKFSSCNAHRGNAFNSICQSGSAPLAFNNSSAIHQITAAVA